MKITCEYCGGFLEDTQECCPNCAATNKNVMRSADGIPKTIEELKAFALKKKLPLEQMRFFLGVDMREPRAFGIYKDEDENFIVYKNKSNGERIVRYRGKDEAYAVNELYQKMRTEVVEQKAHQTVNSVHASKRHSENRKSVSQRNRYSRLGMENEQLMQQQLNNYDADYQREMRRSVKRKSNKRLLVIVLCVMILMMLFGCCGRSFVYFPFMRLFSYDSYDSGYDDNYYDYGNDYDYDYGNDYDYDYEYDYDYDNDYDAWEDDWDDDDWDYDWGDDSWDDSYTDWDTDW